MKIRIGFVSNSSSASFVIDKRTISQDQLNKILNHKDSDLEYADSDAWELEDGLNYLRGSTIIDNFDMRNFLKSIGIKKVHEWQADNNEWEDWDLK